jgi:Pvc16 N-terminal domain/Carboxypeptidase regulatory-like domain
MLHDLDATLRRILDDGAAPAELRNAEVDFRTPDRNFSVNLATVNLFLHQVKENRELRDPVPIVERLGTTFVRRQPPLRADCAYLVTTWANPNQAVVDRLVEEHRLLGQALVWFSRFPTIPQAFLQGPLATNQPFPLPVLVAQLDDNRDTGEFWTALGTSPRPAFHLVVTVALDLAVSVDGPLVTTRATDFLAGADAVAERLLQIGGRVLTPTGQGVADALVDVLDTGVRTRSDEAGRYLLDRVPAGSHTLRVAAVGFQPKTQPLQVPDLPSGYEVTLTPI